MIFVKLAQGHSRGQSPDGGPVQNPESAMAQVPPVTGVPTGAHAVP